MIGSTCNELWSIRKEPSTEQGFPSILITIRENLRLSWLVFKSRVEMCSHGMSMTATANLTGRDLC